jgi:hypothetical protein
MNTKEQLADTQCPCKDYIFLLVLVWYNFYMHKIKDRKRNERLRVLTDEELDVLEILLKKAAKVSTRQNNDTA